ncbi:MAG: protein kinase [Planctomycetota bacterium]
MKKSTDPTSELLQFLEDMAKDPTKTSEELSTRFSLFSSGTVLSSNILEPANLLHEEPTIQLEKRYKILEEWETQEGLIQHVQDHLLGRIVILKTFRLPSDSDLTNNPTKKDSNPFLQEASITAFLEHPNILPLYEIQYLEENKIQFSLRKVGGKKLSDLLLKQQPLETPTQSTKFLDIFLKICEGIHYAHSKGVIHQNLKSEHIKVGDFGEVYILNWGDAKRLSNFERDLETHFQALIQPDIQALGAILHECFADEISGRKIPPEIQAIVNQSTRLSNPYTNVEDLVEDIQRYLKNIPISAKDYHLLEILWKWGKRNRKFLISGLFIFVVFFICGAYFKLKEWTETQRQEEEAYTKYQALKHKAQENIKEAQFLQTSSDIRIQCYLRAITLLNQARSIKSSFAKTHYLSLEKEKLTISKLLLSQCLQDENYQVALYVVEEIKTLSTLSESEKREFLREVQEKKDFTLTQHRQSLDLWVERFKSENDPELQIKEGEPEDFIFEVLQMKEPEILDRLLELLNEGTDSYLQEISKRKRHLDEFYPYLPIVLGHMKNTRAVASLRKCFQQIYQKCYTSPTLEINRIHYLSELVNALCLLNDFESLPSIEKFLNDPQIGKMAHSFAGTAYQKLKDHSTQQKK